MRWMTTWARRVAPALLVLGGTIAVPAVTTATPSGAAATCTHTWKDPVDGDWTDGTKWSTGVAPLFGGDVCITVPGEYRVQGPTVPASSSELGVHVDSIQIGAATGTGKQELRFEALSTEQSLFEVGDIDIGSRGRLTLGDPTDSGGYLFGLILDEIGQISNGGTIVVPANTVGGDAAVALIDGRVENLAGGTLRTDEYLKIAHGDLVNEGTMEVGAPLVVEGSFAGVSGTLSTDGGADDRLVVGAVEGTGTATLHDITTLDEGGSQIVLDGRNVPTDLALTGATDLGVDVLGPVSVDGDLPEGARLHLEGTAPSGSALRFAGTWTNRGTITLRGASECCGPSIEGASAVELVNEGSIVVEAAPPETDAAQIVVPLDNRGTITLGDQLELRRDVRNDGTIDLGTEWLQLYGATTLTAQSRLVLDVEPAGGGGTTRGHVTSTGAVAVAGRLEVTTAPPAPAIGTQLTVLASPSRSGTFSEITSTGPATYDAQYASTTVRLTRRAAESVTEKFVRAAYQDFLDRQPTTSEKAQTAAAIDGGTLTRASLVRQLSRSPEYVTALVQRFYADTLGRPGDPGGVAFWVGELRSGRKTVAQVAGSFYASPEYFNRAGGTNQAWITDLYGVYFERPPGEGDLTFWTNRIAQRGRTRVAIELFQSLESRHQRVDRLYHELLGRDGDADGVDYWASRITGEGDLALAVFLASSTEYLDRAQLRYP